MKQQITKVGFTLIELLAVIVVLGIIGLITIPTVTKTMKDSKEKAYQTQIVFIEDAASKWGAQNSEELPEEGDVLSLSFEDIQKAGLLQAKDVINPKSGKELSGCIYIQYSNAYEQYLYQYQEECEDNVGLWKAPTITVNDKTTNHTIQLEVTDSYTVPIASAVDYEGKKVEVITEGNISPDVPGTYKIIYKATDNKGITGTLVLTIEVKDSTKPTVEYVINTLTSNGWYKEDVEVLLSGEDRDESPKGYEYAMNTGNGYTDYKKITENHFTISNEGNQIQFKVRSRNRNNIYSEELESEILKIDKTKPEIQTTTLDTTTETKEPVTITVKGTDNLSGVKEYSFDGGATWQAENTKKIDTNQTVAIRIKDNASNVSNIKDVKITNIKLEKPKIVYNLESFPFNENGWAKADFSIHVIANTDRSIKTFQYCTTTNGSECTPTKPISGNQYELKITTESDQNRICARVIDVLDQSSGIVCSNLYKLDKTEVNIQPKQTSIKLLYGENANIIDYFEIGKYGISGGNTVCTTENTSNLTIGSHHITCTVTLGNGNSGSALIDVVINKKTMTGADLFENEVGEGVVDTIGDTTYFRGSNPNNWITFNNNLWRIMSMKGDYIKIIQNERFKQAWDSTSGNHVEVNNNWRRPSSLNTYLNTTYYNSLSASARKKIQEVEWNIGLIPRGELSSLTATRLKELEETYPDQKWSTWTGYVAIMNASDYVYASTEQSCIEKVYDNSACVDNNWLYDSKFNYETMLNPCTQNNPSKNRLGTFGKNIKTLQVDRASDYVRPVVHIRKDILIATGKGTETEPYTIK